MAVTIYGLCAVTFMMTCTHSSVADLSSSWPSRRVSPFQRVRLSRGAWPLVCGDRVSYIAWRRFRLTR